MSKGRRSYDKEFKQMAVGLITEQKKAGAVARELGIDANMLRRWKKEHEQYGNNSFAGNGNPVMTEEQKEIARLRKLLRDAEEERDILKKQPPWSGRHLLQQFHCGTSQQKFQFIKDHSDQFAVGKMCKVLKVSRSGYYEWLDRKPSDRQKENEEIKQEVKSVYESSKCRYGSPKITEKLNSKGIKVSRPRVARMMKQQGLKSIIRKRYRGNTTESNHSQPVAQNLLDRNFTVSAPSQVWVSDITYIPTMQGWLYLTIVMDLFDRKVIGWALSDNMSAEDTTIAAWKMAKGNRSVGFNMLFHSDRGIQYACEAFRKELDKEEVIQSMSRKGNCWDNAVAENFFKILKSELVWHQRYPDRFTAKMDIFQFIEIWYNRMRIHSVLGYLTPEEFGTQYYSQAA